MKYLIYISTICLISLYQSCPEHVWERSNPGGGGVFNHIEASINGTIIACSDLSGAYISKDDGNSWEVIGASRGFTETHCSAVGFHKIDGNIFCLGTEDGIYRTDNNGDTLINRLNSGYVSDIEFGTNDSNIAYATYHPQWNSVQGSIYKSIDNGLNWYSVSQDLPSDLRLLKIIVDPTDANIVYVLSGKGRFGCGNADVFKSTNGGINWINITSNQDEILDFTLDPIASNHIYITTMNANCDSQYYWYNLSGELIVSLDQGANWEVPLHQKSGIIWIDKNNSSTIRLIDPRQPYEWISSAGTWTSNDGGITFAKTGDVNNWDQFFNNELFHSYGRSPHAICATLSPDHSDPNSYYWCTNQYVYKTSDNGTTFNNLFTKEVSPGFWKSTGIDNINLLEIESSPADPNIIYAAYFDIGIWRSLDHGYSWQSCNTPEYTGAWNGRGGNGNTLLADPQRSNILWASLSRSQQGNNPCYLLKNTNKGDTSAWENIGADLPSQQIMGLSMDENSPLNNRTLFVSGNKDIYKSINDGENWTKIFDCNGCRFTSVDQVQPNNIYAAGENGVWLSSDSGSTWLDISLPEMKSVNNLDYWNNSYKGVFDLQTDPNNSGWIYVCVFGTDKGLYRSKDYGSSWELLIENDFIRRVNIANQNSNIIYASSSRAFKAGHYNSNSNGIYFTADGGQNWIQQNDGMAFTFALALEIDHFEAPTIFVGSPGTGIQKALLPIPNDEYILALDTLIEIEPNPYANQIIIEGDLEQYMIYVKDENENIIFDLSEKCSPINLIKSQLPESSGYIELKHILIENISLEIQLD